MSITGDHKATKKECRIAEILQHSCEVIQDSTGTNVVECFPVLRFFQLCKGQPAVEITKFIEIDANDGGIEIPHGFRSGSIQGRPWRDVVRYDLDKPDDKQIPGSHPSNTAA